MATPDEVRAEVVRQRGFIRAAETQGTKILALLDELVMEPEPTPEPIPEPEPTPDPEPAPAPEGVLFFDGFESGDLSVSTNGFRWASPNRTSVVRSDQYVTHPNVIGPVSGRRWESRPGSGGSHALRFRYPAGEAMAEQRFTIGSAHRELVASWWLRVPLNFEHLSGNNKLFMFWMDDYSTKGDGSTAGMEFRPDGNGGSEFYVKVSPGRGSVLGGDEGKVPFISLADRGRWMELQVRLKAESAEDASDGLVQVWRRWEGEAFQQTHNVTGQPIRVPAAGPNGFSAGYLGGWANGAYSQDTEFLVDDFTLSGR